MGLNTGDILFQLFGLGVAFLPLILLIVLIIFVVRIVRRTERRAEERLKLDRENSIMLKQQMNAINDLNARLTNIEKMLKEVD
ncbi:hypothetical protein [Neobacillus mesonae]|uniref:hypothetical protein n=1 Tax=Neobacillus mesonae TaxID=1193713 RepID=UPI0008356377|nr:hypothetical protein [Neobacillus mesonae]